MIAQNKYIVSVVVPTYKRSALLIRCLAALMSQDFDVTDYEVIIADDAACDETRRITAFIAASVLPPLAASMNALQRLERTSADRRHVLEMLVTSVLIPPLAIFWRIRGAIKFRVLFL